jgi:hypothetical protein
MFDVRLATTAIAALAAGLAVGTKYTLLAPVGALTIAVVVAALRDHRSGARRAREIGVWCATLAVGGAYFYLRNAVRADNPLPSIGFGPLDLPTPPAATPSDTVAKYLLDGTIWREYFVPGLWEALGPAWWAVVGCTVVGSIAVALLHRDRIVRLLAGVVLAGVVAYLLTPQFLGFPDQPFFFLFNVRYLAPSLALALCIVPTMPALARRHVAMFVLGAYGLVLVATQYGPTIWSWSATAVRSSPFGERLTTFDATAGVLLVGVVVVVGIAFALRSRPVRTSRVTWIVGAVVLVVGVVAAYPLQETYLRRRYTSTPPLPSIFEWAQEQRDARIGVSGVLMHYPLYGRDASNHVEVVGRRGDHGAFARYGSCRSWREALNAGRFDYVVVARPGFESRPDTPEADEAAWTRDGGAEIVMREASPASGVVLFRLDGPLSLGNCD